MKVIYLFLVTILFSQCSLPADQTNLNVEPESLIMDLDKVNEKQADMYLRAMDTVNTIVTGHLIASGYDYKENEKFQFGFLNKWFAANIDSVNIGGQTEFKKLLVSMGIPAHSIIYADIYASSQTDVIEMWFAYDGKLTIDRVDMWIQNAHNRTAGGYAGNDMLYIPNFKYINKAEMLSVANFIAHNYTVKSFNIKPWSVFSLPLLVLARQPRNGVLADMRNIPNSVRLLPYFQDLCWEIIWYQENGVQKSIGTKNTKVKYTCPGTSL